MLSTGRVVESGPASAVLGHPQHAYTRELLDAVPRFDVERLDPSRFEAVG
ncbi:hypothetical protein [Plantibacter sp. M259]|nr:hypothetical protein [Plantibacter sp. M259]